LAPLINIHLDMKDPSIYTNVYANPPFIFNDWKYNLTELQFAVFW